MNAISNISSAAYALTPDVSPAAGSNDPVSTLPPGGDQLTKIVDGGDIGSAVAALVMMTEKDLRKAARTARDATYAQEEAAQKHQIEQMRTSANDGFAGSLIDGGSKLVAAGMNFEGGRADLCGRPMDAIEWKGGSAGLTSGGGIAASIGEWTSKNADRGAKEAGNAAEKAKRIAEDHNDDVHDADKAIDKAMEFFKEWMSAVDASKQAAIHRA